MIWSKRIYGFLLIFLVFLRVQHAFPQEALRASFDRSDYGLHLEYPTIFAPAKAESSQVLLLLQPRGARFPTFNVLVQPGNPEVERKSLVELKNDLVDSYVGVGLYDVDVVTGEKRQVAGRNAYFARVNYVYDKVPLTAGVYILPGKGRYYACTFVATTERFDQDEPYLTEIMNSLTLAEAAPPPPSTSEAHTALLWIATVLGALMIAKFGQRVFLNRIS